MEKLDTVSRCRRLVPLNPDPCREQDAAQGGLREARRDVDDQVADVAIGTSLKVFADGLHGETPANERGRIDHMPSILREVVKGAFQLSSVSSPPQDGF